MTGLRIQVAIILAAANGVSCGGRLVSSDPSRDLRSLAFHNERTLNQIKAGDSAADALTRLGAFTVTEPWSGMPEPTFTIESPGGRRSYVLGDGTEVGVVLLPSRVFDCRAGARVAYRPLVTQGDRVVATDWSWIAARLAEGTYPEMDDRWFWQACPLPGRQR